MTRRSLGLALALVGAALLLALLGAWKLSNARTFQLFGDIVARVDGRRPPMKGESIWVRPQSGHVHLFDTKTGLRLGD